MLFSKTTFLQILLAALFVFPINTSANTMEATIDKENASVGDIIEYSVIFKGKGSMSDISFFPPEFEGFYVVGQSQNKSFVFVNGIQQTKLTWNFSLEVAEENIREIKAAKLSFLEAGKEKVISSNILSFNSTGGVLKKKTRPFQENKNKKKESKQSVTEKGSSLQKPAKPKENNKINETKDPNFSNKNSYNSYGLETKSQRSFTLETWMILVFAFVFFLTVLSFALIKLISPKKVSAKERNESLKNTKKDALSSAKELINSDTNLKDRFLGAEKLIREKLIEDKKISYSTTNKELKELMNKGKISKEVFEIIEIAELAKYGKLAINEEVLEKTTKVLLEL